MNKLLADTEIDIKKVFSNCKSCNSRERFYSFRSEFKKMGFFTFNKGVKYWDVRDHDQFEIIPIKDPKFRM